LTIRTPTHTTVEILQSALQLLLRVVALSDIFEGSEQPDHFTVDSTQRHLVGFDPPLFAIRSPEPFENAELRLAVFDHGSVPIDEPLGTELCIVCPRHVAVRLAHQE
jgi:hypothetical protein